MNHPTRQAVLAAMPGTVTEIAERIGKGKKIVARWADDLRQASESHIGAWQQPPNGGPNMAVHHAGPGADVVCELPRTWPKRRPVTRGGIPPRDPITTALFGPA